MATAKKKAAERTVDRYPIVAALQDGRLVIISSEDDVSTVDHEKGENNVVFLFDPIAMSFARVCGTNHRTYLSGRGLGSFPEPDGRAVFVDIGSESRAMFYDAKKDAWQTSDSFKASHENGGTTLLEDGRILVAGGERGYPYRSSDSSVFDPKTKKWAASSRLNVERSTGCLLSLEGGGAILICGEVKAEPYPQPSDAVESWDPSSNLWKKEKPAPLKMTRPRATQLPDGRVFLASPGEAWAIFDPKAKAWGEHGELDHAREVAIATDAGDILFFGVETTKGEYDFNSVSRLDVKKNKLTKIGSTSLPHYGGVAVRLPNDNALLVGGDLYNNIANEPELWNAKSKKGTPLPGLEKAIEKQVKKLAAHREKQKKK